MSADIRAIIFDLGGVLLQQTGRTARRRWERRLGLTEGELDRIYAECIGPGWEGGRSEDEINERLLAATGLSRCHLSDLLDALSADHRLEPALVALIGEIRPRYRVGVLANAGPTARQVWSSRLLLDQLVDAIVISAEEGIAKPDTRIYQIAAARLGVTPRQCAFVDDKQENVAGAETAGMLGIHYTGASAAITAL